jgi:hypothetical protein
MDGAGHRGLDVDSVNSSSDYFAYLCIAGSETTLHQNEGKLRKTCQHSRPTDGNLNHVTPKFEEEMLPNGLQRPVRRQRRW